MPGHVKLWDDADATHAGIPATSVAVAKEKGNGSVLFSFWGGGGYIPLLAGAIGRE